MRTCLNPVLGLCVLVIAGWTLFALGAEPTNSNLDPNLPYQARRSNAVTYDVDFAVVVTAPYHTKKLKVWLPLPQSDAGQEVEEGELTTFPMKASPKVAKEPAFGNRFAYFEFDHPEGGQLIRHKFKIKVWELHWDVDPAKVVRIPRWPSSFDRYLKSDRAVQVDDRLSTLTREIVPEQKNPAEDLIGCHGLAWRPHDLRPHSGFAASKLGTRSHEEDWPLQRLPRTLRCVRSCLSAFQRA